MVVYTHYSKDTRVLRAAEALVASHEKEVFVLSLKESNKPKIYIQKGVEIHELDVGKYRGFSNIKYLFSYILFILSAFFQCNRLLFKKSLDIVHIHNMPNTLILSAIIPFLFGKKLILDEHDTMPETYMAKFENNRYKDIIRKILEIEESICCRLAYKVICVNHIQQEALIKRKVPENKTLIYMNLPDPRVVNYKNQIKESPDREGKFKLCYHGTITSRLGIDLGIRAIKKIEGMIPGLEFHVFGEGEGKEECIAVSEEMGLKNCVSFRGQVLFEELVSIISSMDLGLIPSRKNEATELMLPVKMLEYIALGIPVVAPRLKAIEYYFCDDMIFYFDAENIESMCDAIILAFKNKRLAKEKAINARNFFNNYDWYKQNKYFVDMYDNVLSCSSN